MEPRSQERPFVSVVVPIYNSERTLHHLYDRLAAVLDSLAGSWEIILVDDASRDRSYMVMCSLRARDSRVKLIQFAHNHGQHHATLCGMRYAKGDVVFTLDDDLQNPPEEMSKFLEKISEGFDVVIGRIQKKEHSHYRNFGSSAVQRLAEYILDKPKGLYLSSYRAFARSAVERISNYAGVHPYFPALILKSVHRDSIVNVDVRHDERMDGKSNYTLRRLIKLASYLLINHSLIPLRVMVVWGFFISAASILFAVYVFFRAMSTEGMALGWPSLAVLVSFLSGNMLMGMGVIGEYLARLVEEKSTVSQFDIHRIEF